MEISFFSSDVTNFIDSINNIKKDLIERLENNHNLLKNNKSPSKETINNYKNILNDFEKYIQIYGILPEDKGLLEKYESLNLS